MIVSIPDLCHFSYFLLHLPKLKSKKGHNSVQILRMISQFELHLDLRTRTRFNFIVRNLPNRIGTWSLLVCFLDVHSGQWSLSSDCTADQTDLSHYKTQSLCWLCHSMTQYINSLFTSLYIYESVRNQKMKFPPSQLKHIMCGTVLLSVIIKCLTD